MLLWRGTWLWGSGFPLGSGALWLLCLVSLGAICDWSLPRRFPERQEKLKVLYIRIVSPFPEMEQFIQATVKR